MANQSGFQINKIYYIFNLHSYHTQKALYIAMKYGQKQMSYHIFLLQLKVTT